MTGPVRNKPIQLESGNIITPTSTEIDRWEIHFELFHHDLSKWEIIVTPNSDLQAIQPVIIDHKNNTLQALCRTKHSYIAQTWSHDNGLTWSALEPTNLSNPNAAIDAIRCGDLGYLLVYNNSQFGRYQLEIACSTNGIDWEDKLTLENTLGEFSYPSLTLSQDGSLHILYTHNRTNVKHVELSGQEVKQLFETAKF